MEVLFFISVLFVIVLMLLFVSVLIEWLFNGRDKDKREHPEEYADAGKTGEDDGGTAE